MNEYESNAMWKTFTNSNEAVVVRSTYSRLRESLDNEAQIGIVHYIDHNKNDIPEVDRLTRFMHKGKFFEDERELRAIILRSPKLKPDEQEPVWSRLRNMAVAPDTPDWCKEFVEKIVRLYKHEQSMDILRMEPLISGEWKSVDLDKLIEDIIVAPKAPDWFKQLVEDVLKRYGLAKPVIKSSLDSTPFF